MIGAAGAVLALSGCDEEQRAVALPSSTDSRTPLASSAAADQRAAELAYRQFVALLDRADSLPAGSRKQQLATVMAEPQLSRVLKRIADMKERHLATYGSVIVHVTNTELTASGATVLDCQDARNAGIVNTATQKKVNRGVKEDSTKALLIKGADGRWRVSKSISLGEGC